MRQTTPHSVSSPLGQTMTLNPNIPRRARKQQLNTVKRIVSRSRATHITSKNTHASLLTPDDVYTMCVAHNLSLPLCFAICHHETTTHIINFHFPTNLVLDVNRLFRPHSAGIVIPLTLIPILYTYHQQYFQFHPDSLSSHSQPHPKPIPNSTSSVIIKQ